MKPLAQNTLIQNRYLIVHLIGKGGMGEVYLAVDQRLGSAVALKRTFFAGDEMLGNAFEREARILARMRHPVLPKVSDHFSENEEQYLVMEHISGDDLAKRLETAGKPFPVSWVLFWADQLLDALSYLHSHEPPIIHRDIKPQNLKLTDENHVILLDFGLSKSSTGQTHISRSGGSTGSVVGYTPHYAPMEQIRGIGTNARSDLYSLSATLYQLMTGVVPPDALTRADTMLNELPDPITAPSELNPEIPRDVSGIILRGMEVSQDKRFATAREMQKGLRHAFSQMQQAMTAQTVAFNINTEGLGSVGKPASLEFQNGEVFESAEIISDPQTGSNSAPAIVSQPGGTPDFDATLAFDPVSTPSHGKQSDIKTEVFSGNSFPNAAAAPTGESRSANDTFNGRNESFEGSQPDPAHSSGAQATVPLVSLGEAESLYNDFDSQPKGDARPAYASAGAASAAHSGNTVQASSTSPAARAVAPPAKSKSNGKAFLMLAGLAAFFILAIGAAGAGWYFYQNYYGASTEVQATPTPAPEQTPVPTPSPEPTVESVLGSNSLIDSNSNSETFVNSDPGEPRQTDRTAIASEPSVRTTPQSGRPSTGRPTPTRSASTPVTAPTTKPKPTPSRPVILQ